MEDGYKEGDKEHVRDLKNHPHLDIMGNLLPACIDCNRIKGNHRLYSSPGIHYEKLYEGNYHSIHSVVRQDLEVANGIQQNYWLGEHVIKYEDLNKQNFTFAEGGQGKLFLGQYQYAPVAIKEFKMGDFGDEARAEAKILLSIRARTEIISLVGVCDDKTKGFFLVYPYYEKSLHDLIHVDRFELSVKSMEIAYIISRGLAYLHEKGIIHRDIKCRNVMMDGMRPIIADFGLSKQRKDAELVYSYVGTYNYMAPEVQQRGYNESADIYSFGILLWEMVERKIPSNQNPPVINDNLNISPDTKKIPREFLQIIRRCLSLEPSNRDSAKALVSILDGMRKWDNVKNY
eukprot:TRINITY_DN7083_c0_g2_i1.p1 TRINITY_DN7083_c0_g2~~TRINITY_DN7083_c0_g2_i1.p1  ORF type:complete len:362 (+),score=67.71 TRINITY_DN7083_c0_g2_i1:54-1088(+)